MPPPTMVERHVGPAALQAGRRDFAAGSLPNFDKGLNQPKVPLPDLPNFLSTDGRWRDIFPLPKLLPNCCPEQAGVGARRTFSKRERRRHQVDEIIDVLNDIYCPGKFLQ